MKPNLKKETKQKEKKINPFLNIADNSLHPKCVLSVDEPIFQPQSSHKI